MAKPVAVVVGIGPKNGAAFSRRFAADGYAVAMLSRSTTLSEELAKELEDARAFACDVSDPASVERAFTTVAKEMGPVEVLVYNAGSGTWGNIEEITLEQLETSWRINAGGLFAASKQVIPSMVEREKGSIIVVGATASLRGKPFTTAFAPAKAAQRSLAQAMARHLAPKGVHVGLIIIDGMVTKPGSEGSPPEKLSAGDIAHAASFLASQPRSAWTFELDVRPQMESW